MKKIISLSLAVMLVALLVGCSCNSDEKTETVDWKKGESLFSSQIEKYYNACQDSEAKDVKTKQILTTGFGEVAKEKNLAEKIGYTFADLNGDGTEELLVSLVGKKDKLDNYIIAAYQYTSDGIKRLLEGWSENTYYLMKNKNILNQASGGEDDAEISKLHMRDGGFEYLSQLAMKYNEKGKINYLYAEVGKPENTKQSQIDKKKWQEICKSWEDEVDTTNVKKIKDFK